MPDLPEVNYRGKVSKIDNKIIELDLYNGKKIEFQRSGKTKFFKDDQEIKAAALKIGDPVSVDATEDPQAYLDAVRVSYDRAPPPEQPAASESSDASLSSAPPIENGSNGRPTLRRRQSDDSDQPESETASGSGLPAPPSSAGLPSGNGLPTLRRRDTGESEPPESEGTPGGGQPAPFGGANPPASPLPPLPGSLNRPVRQQDALIETARTAAASYSSQLPNFLCQEVMARFSRSADETTWQPLDVVSTDVVFQDGSESHRNFKINDQPSDQENMSGSWPILRLVTSVSDLLSPDAAAEFRSGGEMNLPNLEARIYDFDVRKENSQWIMRMGSQEIHAAYGGSAWIAKDSGQVLRLEMQARELPADFPLDQVETDIEYGAAHFGANTAMLPMHVETIGCQREAHACSRSVIDFKNFRPAP